VVIHPRYNPEGITQYNIVPGLLGVILTMTLVMITGVAMTRETERGTMENLLVMPSSPFEVMIGTIMPFLGVGAVQTLIFLLVVHWLFAVPFVGSISLLLMSVVLFIIANLALDFTLSTIAKA
jgi:ABC-2 type transport system permease protein